MLQASPEYRHHKQVLLFLITRMSCQILYKFHGYYIVLMRRRGCDCSFERKDACGVLLGLRLTKTTDCGVEECALDWLPLPLDRLEDGLSSDLFDRLSLALCVHACPGNAEGN